MGKGEVRERGFLGFEVGTHGNLVNNPANVERLRQLWLDRSVINGDWLGPGDPGDFDHGAWHVASHLVAACGVRRATDGRLLWFEISNDAASDLYYPTVTLRDDTGQCIVPLDTEEGERAFAASTLLGFVEGNSTGRISASGVCDAKNKFNGNLRQDYDHPADDPTDGGRVWEHWCTLRDLRPSSETTTSVLSAYIALVSVLGDAFAAIVARSRHEYHHLDQLCAMVNAGFISREAALLDLLPTPIPAAETHNFSCGDSRLALERSEVLDWRDPPRFYMFERKLSGWIMRSTIAESLGPINYRRFSDLLVPDLEREGDGRINNG